MLTEGQPAPDFKVKNEAQQKISLSGLRGKNIVLYFYPKDDTPGCTKEACGFRDLESEFAAMNTIILGVSPDTTKSHEKFKNKYQLPFQLLSDENKDVVEKYGVWKEKNMYGRKYMGVERTTFVIDSAGVIRKIFPKVKVAQHPEAVLDAVKALS